MRLIQYTLSLLVLILLTMPMSTFATDATQNEAKNFDIGHGLAFDGEGDHIDIGYDSIFNIEEEITLEIWFNPEDSMGEHQGLIGRWDSIEGVWLVNLKGGKINFFPSPNYALTVNVGNIDGYWHHLACTFSEDTNETHIYLNGVEVGTGSYDGNIAKGSRPLLIGEYDGVKNFQGQLDMPMIYERALPIEVVIEHYRFNYNDTTGLVAGWDFEEGVGQWVNDISGNAMNGSVVGAHWTNGAFYANMGPVLTGASVSPLIGTPNTGINISVRARDLDGVKEVWAKINYQDQEHFNVTLTEGIDGNYYFNRSYPFYGEYVLTISASDQEDFWTYTNGFSFEVLDEVPPEFNVQPTLIALDVHVFDHYTISTLIVDDSDIDLAYALVTEPDDVVVNITLTEGINEWTGDLIPLMPGSYSIDLYAKDIFGNWNSSVEESLSVHMPDTGTLSTGTVSMSLIPNIETSYTNETILVIVNSSQIDDACHVHILYTDVLGVKHFSHMDTASSDLWTYLIPAQVSKGELNITIFCSDEDGDMTTVQSSILIEEKNVEPEEFPFILFIGIFGLVLALVGGLIFALTYFRGEVPVKEEKSEATEVESSEKLALLEKRYEEGHIAKETYEQLKERYQ